MASGPVFTARLKGLDALLGRLKRLPEMPRSQDLSRTKDLPRTKERKAGHG
ncbi:hypothetical protein MWN34_05415 [Ancylobacter sp. 6x-1]|uniref:Uncharacterized protein n=1 Tax=Ancylobacter crimeensis TaxID=2579147 RepID=A0ABT0D8R8_9HYPH|nr:hypothetical protein [Ancylobacter crimeensis]MCK0196349.1 hypothetical protein [Ancylobacter crimeensis]